MHNDELYMSRCIDLAKKGFGSVSPNPMVGAVIVHNGHIIGEGYHEKFGGPHAEVNAVESVKDKSVLKYSTIYVSLEPCSFKGKTGACLDLILKHGFSKVVIGSIDPNPKVSGKSIKALQHNGVEVKTGILEKACIDINKRFWINQIEKRPYVILKYAQTKDCFIAREDYSSKWISSEESRKLVHEWRAQEDGIMVAKNTAFYDNPSLNVRLCEGDNPVRIIIDPNGVLPENLNVFVDGLAPTLRIVGKDTKITRHNQADYTLANADFTSVQGLKALFESLLLDNIGSILVEGGATWINTLLKADLWDEARVFTSNKYFEKGISSPFINGLQPIEKELIGGDELSVYFRV